MDRWKEENRAAKRLLQNTHRESVCVQETWPLGTVQGEGERKRKGRRVERRERRRRGEREKKGNKFSKIVLTIIQMKPHCV